MSRRLTTVSAAILFSLCVAATASVRAQENAGDHSPRDGERDQSWYHREPTDYRPDTRAIIFQKAQSRAAQRNARLSSMSWYGMSNSRPTAAPTPFTTLYSPVWQQPGGRPFAWHTASWPTYAYITR